MKKCFNKECLLCWCLDLNPATNTLVAKCHQCWSINVGIHSCAPDYAVKHPAIQTSLAVWKPENYEASSQYSYWENYFSLCILQVLFVCFFNKDIGSLKCNIKLSLSYTSYPRSYSLSTLPDPFWDFALAFLCIWLGRWDRHSRRLKMFVSCMYREEWKKRKKRM